MAVPANDNDGADDSGKKLHRRIPSRTTSEKLEVPTNTELHKIALRLANIEALLVELLERRRANARLTTKRRDSTTERVRAKALQSELVTEAGLQWARRAIANKRR